MISPHAYAHTGLLGNPSDGSIVGCYDDPAMLQALRKKLEAIGATVVVPEFI